MAEDKNLVLAKKIEKLIVDGNKDVLGRFDRLEANFSQRLGTLEEGQKAVIDLIKRLDSKVDKVDRKHDVSAQAQYDLMQDVKKGVGEIKEKLETHLRVPHAV